MDKKLFIHLQGGRKVSGTLRGFDIFLNLVIDDAVDETVTAHKTQIGTVVCSASFLSPLSVTQTSFRSFVATASLRSRLSRLSGNLY